MRSLTVLGRLRRFSSKPVSIPTEKLLKLRVNGEELQVPDTATIMQACQLAGVDIPRFCYHERLGIAGNCRMCLVQVNESPKLIASCAAPVLPDMRISTESIPVKKGREGVMEFLLANHPLDCPICDQGGECDLQDQAMAFGSDRSRFQINKHHKRATEDKDFGPLVKTSMNRCIHCTRCVRFANEIAGVQELGTTGRGNDMEIGTYIGQMIDSPLSGNIIDLCPVGALTSKPYAFTARPWELRRTDSIDVMDAVGANIKIDSRGMEVKRILPRVNEEINEEWLADKSRFSYDGLRQQRLVQPLWKNGESLVPVTWEDALTIVANKIASCRRDDITGIIGRFADVESIFALQKLFESLGSKSPLIVDGCTIPSDSFPPELARELRLTTTIRRLGEADAILLIGCNPKLDSPLVNARIRKTWLYKDVSIGLIGQSGLDLTYDYEYLGDDHTAISNVINNRETSFARKLYSAKNPVIIVGQDALFRHSDVMITLKTIQELSITLRQTLFQENWCGLNLLPLTAGITGALMIGCSPGSPAKSKFVYLLNADDFVPDSISPDAFVVYQGHHGDVGANIATLILPSAAYTEKDSIYVNMEGRPQLTRRAVPPPGEARGDWEVIRALSEFTGSTLPFDNLHEIRKAISEEYPELTNFGQAAPSSLGNVIPKINISIDGSADSVPSALYSSVSMKDYYLTDCISRNSRTMAKCSLAFTHKVIKDSKQLEFV